MIFNMVLCSDEIKDYFGHRIGLYFLYLQHYVTLLIVPAFLGFITFVGLLSSYY
jgi:hypothetical protein